MRIKRVIRVNNPGIPSEYHSGLAILTGACWRLYNEETGLTWVTSSNDLELGETVFDSNDSTRVTPFPVETTEPEKPTGLPAIFGQKLKRLEVEFEVSNER